MRKFEKYLGTTLIENQILHRPRCPKFRVDRVIDFKENEENPWRHAENLLWVAPPLHQKIRLSYRYQCGKAIIS